MRLEQPMPETNAISCGGRPIAANARVSAVTTPKSPQPGHQMGLRSLLKSPAWNFGVATDSRVSMVDSPGILWSVLDRFKSRMVRIALGGSHHLAQPFKHFCRLNWI